jgi:uncharacterized protein involved in type VI secretion and phage assembly
MSRVVSLLGALAQHEVARQPTCELGVVVDVSDSAGPSPHTIDVRLPARDLSLPKIPFASGLSGFAALPRVGDIVLVLFLYGDLNHAVAVGNIYSSARTPPQFDKDEALFSFPGDAEEDPGKTIEIRLSVKDGRKVKIALGGSQDTSLTLEDGKIALVAGDVSVTFAEQETKLDVAVGDTKMSFANGQGVTIDGGTKITLKATQIAIEGDAKVAIKGAMVELN